MRLLDTTTLKFKEFWGAHAPPYAILSHTWSKDGKDEVTFHDLQNGRAEKKAGFAKLRRFCTLAKDHQLSYAWMDTCCIDKTSSAELSEAINSMYRWYETSVVCFAYLEDIHDNIDPTKENSKFSQSRWFTRGWTLQELIAPSYIYFYSTNWKILGSKRKIRPAHGDLNRYGNQFPIPDLCQLLSKITGISLGVLKKQLAPQDCSAASRMSWAASRQTTRPEDIAYCLMGMFDVNMPLLYGEGEKKAFNRLQEEILRVTQDDTLLMHICPETLCYHTYHPPLASSPKGFRGLGAVQKGEKDQLFHGRNISSQMTPNGLQVQLPVCPCVFEHSRLQGQGEAYIAILDCIVPGSYLDRGVIVLKRLSNNAFGRYPNSVVSRLDFEKQEVVLKPEGVEKATSIQINDMRLRTIQISDYTRHDVLNIFAVKDHLSLVFQEIQQPPDCYIVLQGDIPPYRGNANFVAKQARLFYFMDKKNSDEFIVILGAHKIVRGGGENHSVPYCKIFVREPNRELADILNEELKRVMYPDQDPDSRWFPVGPGQLPFSRPPSPQCATLELTGSKIAEASISTKRFLSREEHRLKLTVKEKT